MLDSHTVRNGVASPTTPIFVHIRYRPFRPFRFLPSERYSARVTHRRRRTSPWTIHPSRRKAFFIVRWITRGSDRRAFNNTETHNARETRKRGTSFPSFVRRHYVGWMERLENTWSIFSSRSLDIGVERRIFFRETGSVL